VALQRARQAIRRREEWAAPFYWAPFVLIGASEAGREWSVAALASERVAGEVELPAKAEASGEVSPEGDRFGTKLVLLPIGASALLVLGTLVSLMLRSRKQSRPP
jgi:hypothetical protein